MENIKELLRTHFDDCTESSGEKSLTRDLLIRAANEIEKLEDRIVQLDRQMREKDSGNIGFAPIYKL